MKSNRYILLIALSLISTISWSQEEINNILRQHVPMSPQVSSMVSFVESPVSHARGNVAVTVPITSVSSNKISSDVSLQYHSGGVKVKQIASAVGLGWSLNAGGVISRQVMGGDDFEGGDGLLANSNFNPTSANDLRAFYDGESDLESDIFYYRFGNYSGKFVFDRFGEIHLYTDNELRIERTGAFFKVTTPNGDIYEFNHTETGGRQLGCDPNSRTLLSSNPITAWHLTKIRSYDLKDSIVIDYYSRGQHSVTSAEVEISTTITSSNGGCIPCSTLSGLSNGCTTNNLNSSTDIKSITSNTQIVEFDYSARTGITNLYNLNKITIYQRQPKIVEKSYVLTNSYFSSTGRKRLRLDAVQEYSSSGTDSIPPYTFTYSTTSLSDPESKAIDHWGYANSKSSTQDLLSNYFPPMGDDQHFGNVNRAPDNSSLQGLLNRVDFPSGWFEEFDYEMHEYGAMKFPSNGVSTNGIVKHVIATESTPKNFVVCEEYPSVTLTYNVQDNCRTGFPECFAEFEVVDSQDNIVYSGPPNGTTYDHIEMIHLAPGEYTVRPGLIMRDSFRVDVSYLIRDSLSLTSRNAGGPRIKSITNPDGVTKYEYKRMDDGRSSGVLVDVPSYSGFMRTYRGCPDSPDCFVECSGRQRKSVSLSSSLSSDHLMYTQVQEIHPDSSETHYTYDFDQDNYPATVQPPVPNSSKEQLRGQLINKKVYSYDDSTLKLVQNDSIIYNYVSLNTTYSYSLLDKDPECLRVGYIDSKTYEHYSYATQTSERHTTTYGTDSSQAITTSTSYEYSAVRPSLMTKESMINSDGVTYSTATSYTFDYGDLVPTLGFYQGTSAEVENYAEAIEDSLLARNIILPLLTLSLVEKDGTMDTVDGQITIYDFYHTSFKTWNIPSIYNPSSFYDLPYQSRTFRYERTWNRAGALLAGSWVQQSNNYKYDFDVGKPSGITLEGWSAAANNAKLLIHYEDIGTVKDVQWLNRQQTVSYYNGTQRIDTMVAPDGTYSAFQYDDFQRLKRVDNYCGDTRNIRQDYEYRYPTASNKPMGIKTRIKYAKLGTFENKHLDQYKVMDGLGRIIEERLNNRSPYNSIRHISTFYEYDNMGRPSKVYEPNDLELDPDSLDATRTTGEYTETTYEASALNRPISTMPVIWDATQQKYGTNQIADSVYDHHHDQLYAAGALHKQIVIDPEGQVSEIYTDRRGQVVLSRIKASENTIIDSLIRDTYYAYDYKGRRYLTIPPQTNASSATQLFRCLYSGDDQKIWQDKPDCAPDTMIYDDRGLLTYRQNGEMHLAGRWYAYAYDDFGQITAEGWAYSSTGPIVDTLITQQWGASGISTGKVTSSTHRVLGSDQIIKRDYTHDECGRVYVTSSNSLLYPQEGSIIDSLELDSRGAIVKSYQSIVPDGVLIMTGHTFDFSGRESTTSMQVTTPEAQWDDKQISEKRYTHKNQIRQLRLGGNLQRIDYSYFRNRLLRTINGTSLLGSDLFQMEFNYHEGIGARTDGNIASIEWNYKMPDGTYESHSYQYQYDFLKRLTQASDPMGMQSSEYVYSNHQGNFKSVMRKSGGQIIDDLVYDYHTGTNQVKTVGEASPATAAIKDKGYKSNTNNSYQHDNNGAITYDPSRNIHLHNTHFNLPYKIEVPDSNGIVMYYYSADGTLHRQEEIRDSVVVIARDYIGSVEYINGAIDQIKHSNGYIAMDRGLSDEHLNLKGAETTDNTYESLSIVSDRDVPSPRVTEYRAQEYVVLSKGFGVALGAEFSARIDTFPIQQLDYRFFITDHQGNIRTEFKDSSGTAVVVASHNYYPFGLQWESTTTADTRNSYTYNGKELQKSFDLGYLNYGARFHDPSIGRFLSTDRFSEKYAPMTPYQYGANSPVNFVDINGDSIKYANAEIQDYIEQYTSPTITKSNGKTKKNKKYDADFANVIKLLEESELMFNFTDDGSSLSSGTLGQVSPHGDGHNFDIIVPDHSGTSKSSTQDLFGGRGALLAEETYHAAQVVKGDIITSGKGFVGTNKSSIIGAEIDAKIWTANRRMSKMRTKIQDTRVPTIIGLIKSAKGNRGKVYDLLTQETRRTISRANGGTITVTYPKTYDPN